MKKLNLGCGHSKIVDWTNVDKIPTPITDEIWNLEDCPWPWEKNSTDEVCLSHVLEHLGSTTEKYLRIWQELYRICCHGAKVYIFVPDPRHDDFLGDPTHVRPITLGGLQLFDKTICQEFIEKGGANTPLALNLNIDFRVTEATMSLDEPFKSQYPKVNGELKYKIKTLNNVVKRREFTLQCVKE